MEKSKTPPKGAGKIRPGHEQPQTNLQKGEGEKIQQPQQKQKQQQGPQQKGKKVGKTGS